MGKGKEVGERKRRWAATASIGALFCSLLCKVLLAHIMIMYF